MKNNFIIKDNFVIFDVMYKGIKYDAVIDIDDFHKISKFKNLWTPVVKKDKIECVRTRQIENGIRKAYKVHNIIMNCPYGYVVDHINGNTLDNRKCNLRVCTKKENSQNVHISKSKTGVRNVTIQDGKYRVRINKISYGVYDTMDEAIAVANEKRKLHFSLPI